MKDIRTGLGYDVHALVENRPLIIGGVTIPYHLGLKGHSDADVLLHTITDALLGALALGDLGMHFPDDDEAFKNVDSRILLRKAVQLIHQEGYIANNVDATIVAQKPKMAPHILKMRKCIAGDLDVDLSRISVKATTSESLGFVGREQGISCHATVLVIQK